MNFSDRNELLHVMFHPWIFHPSTEQNSRSFPVSHSQVWREMEEEEEEGRWRGLNLGAGGKKSRERRPLWGFGLADFLSAESLLLPAAPLIRVRSWGREGVGRMKKERIIRELESKRWRRRSVGGDNELCSFDELCYFDLASSLDLYSGEGGRGRRPSPEAGGLRESFEECGWI